jgi:hypothetical protein
MNEPSDASSDGEVAALLDLYSVERVAGHTERPRWEASVEFGKPQVERADSAARQRFARQVDIQRWELNYVTMPFSLLRIEHGHYADLRLDVHFDHEDVIAKYLAPDEHNKDDLPVQGIARPTGLGAAKFGWHFTPLPGAEELHPRGHVVFFLLQRPKEPADYDLTLAVEATIVRKTVVLNRRTAKLQRPARFRLSFEYGTITPLPS